MLPLIAGVSVVAAWGEDRAVGGPSARRDLP